MLLTFHRNLQHILALLCYLARGVTLPGAVFDDLEGKHSWRDISSLLYSTLDEEYDSAHCTYNAHMVCEHLIENR